MYQVRPPTRFKLPICLTVSWCLFLCWLWWTTTPSLPVVSKVTHVLQTRHGLSYSSTGTSFLLFSGSVSQTCRVSTPTSTVTTLVRSCLMDDPTPSYIPTLLSDFRRTLPGLLVPLTRSSFTKQVYITIPVRRVRDPLSNHSTLPSFWSIIRKLYYGSRIIYK